MKLGYIGLGKMGYNMALRLLEKKHEVVAFDTNEEVVKNLVAYGAVAALSLEELISLLPEPRTIWLMVPAFAPATPRLRWASKASAGKPPVDEILEKLLPRLQTGDTIIDGGNSLYKESMRRANMLEEKGMRFLDAGISGGPAGAKNGACVMVGGKKDVVAEYEQLFRDIAAENAYAHVGGPGAGHFVKMIHNGIEYGMMQALAEGFEILKTSGFNLNLVQVAELYNHQSVIESRLVGWLKDALEKRGDSLEGVSGSVDQSGEGEWTVEAARDLHVPAPIIEGSVEFRKKSAASPSFTGKVLSALRNEFGGHSVDSHNS